VLVLADVRNLSGLLWAALLLVLVVFAVIGWYIFDGSDQAVESPKLKSASQSENPANESPQATPAPEMPVEAKVATPAVTATITLSTWLERGQEALDRDDLQAALEALNEALKLAPEDVAAHDRIGFVLLGLKRPEAATKHFEIARKTAEFAASSTFGLAQIAAEAKDWTTAEALCEESLKQALQGSTTEAAKALLVELTSAREERERTAEEAEKTKARAHRPKDVSPQHSPKKDDRPKTPKKPKVGVTVDTSI